MREIKFRVFIKWLKIILEVESIDFVKKRVYCKTEIGKQNPCDFYNFDDVVLMQYTGFKDAINKSEVYEHDIINFLGVGFLKVEWDYKDTGWICLDKRYKKRSLVDVLLSGGIKVGNIYENPELLESK